MTNAELSEVRHFHKIMSEWHPVRNLEADEDIRHHIEVLLVQHAGMTKKQAKSAHKEFHKSEKSEFPF